MNLRFQPHELGGGETGAAAKPVAVAGDAVLLEEVIK
jgi:hypothetical protein